MLGTLLQLRRIQDADILQRAHGITLRAAHDGIAFGVFRSIGIVFPPGSGVQHNALVEP
jgi:hypothetical protein